MIITVGNQKGGTGKSVIAQTLAVAFSQDSKVLLIDADKQATTSSWYSERIANRGDEGERLSVIHAEGNTIKTMAEQASGNGKTVIIDIGGYESRNMRSALLASDVVVSPVKPKQNDMLSFDDFVTDIVRGIEREKYMSKGSFPVYVVFNMVPTHAAHRDAEEAKSFVRENFSHVNMVDCVLRERIDYDRLSGEGLSAFESTNTALKHEVIGLLEELKGGLNGLQTKKAS